MSTSSYLGSNFFLFSKGELDSEELSSSCSILRALLANSLQLNIIAGYKGDFHLLSKTLFEFSFY